MTVKISNVDGVLRVLLIPSALDIYEDIVMETFGKALGFQKSNRVSVGGAWESVASAHVNAIDPASDTPSAPAQ